MKTKLTEVQIQHLDELLAKVKFPLPRPVFEWWTANCPTMALELGIVRQGKWGPEIFMTKRGRKDPVWPNEWHIPGTVLRTERIRSAYKRLVVDEVSGTHFGPLRSVGVRDFPKGEGPYRCRRGFETARIHMVRFNGKSLPNGRFFPFSRLPKRTISFHRTMIAMIRAFLE